VLVVQKLQCQCEGNTCGDSCERCCPKFNQVPWQQGTYTEAFECQGLALVSSFSLLAQLHTSLFAETAHLSAEVIELVNANVNVNQIFL